MRRGGFFDGPRRSGPAECHQRYFLDELDSNQRDQFEERFFDCQDCATDVRVAAMFVEHSKEILAEVPSPHPVREADEPPWKKWFGWLSPALTVPVMVLLLAV